MCAFEIGKSWRWMVVPVLALTIACAPGAPGDGMGPAAEVTGIWTTAVNAGDAAALSALYTDTARVLPPGGPALSGRAEIESYWKTDLGAGAPATSLTPVAATTQGDLLHVEGNYEAKGANGATLARGQYEQLWVRTGGAWRVQHELWRLDSGGGVNTELAERLTASWTQAYNAGDGKGLGALYAPDSILSSVQDGTFIGRPAIEAFWIGDLGGKPTSTLMLTDAYVAGDLAHFEGEYKVEEKGRPVTEGRYTQLWMRESGGEWRIHRELWWR
jgi:ketosteroid isomerase-like protein